MNIRNLKNKTGQMRVIETIIASFIIVAALSFFSIFAVSPPSAGYEMTDLEKTGYSALHDLDQQGLLTPLIYTSRWNDTRAILKMTMANDVYFNLTVKKLDGSPFNAELIRFGDSTTFSDAENVASVIYCLVGIPEPNGYSTRTSYDPRILVLELTRG